MVISPKTGRTELELWAATSEELDAGTGNAGEFLGGWKRVAPHLAPGHTWYRFKFVKPGEHLGMALGDDAEALARALRGVRGSRFSVSAVKSRPVASRGIA